MTDNREPIDYLIRRKYEGLVAELAEQLDLQAGSAECAAAARHGALVEGLREELDLDAGLRAIASTSTEEPTAQAPTATDHPLPSSGGGEVRPRTRPHRWSGRAVLAAGPLTPIRSGLVSGVWRWRYELAACLILGLVYAILGPVVMASVLAALAVTAMVDPRARRLVRSVVVQHRLQVGFVQTCLANSAGRYPVILHARSQARVIQMTVLCPAGITLQDFHAAAPVLAAACSAAELVMARSPRHPSVLRLILIL